MKPTTISGPDWFAWFNGVTVHETDFSGAEIRFHGTGPSVRCCSDYCLGRVLNREAAWFRELYSSSQPFFSPGFRSSQASAVVSCNSRNLLCADSNFGRNASASVPTAVSNFLRTAVICARNSFNRWSVIYDRHNRECLVWSDLNVPDHDFVGVETPPSHGSICVPPKNTR